MRYRNIVTGAEFESQCEITAPDWITVGADTPLIRKEPKEEPSAKEPSAPQVAPPITEEKKTVTKKPAPKNKARKGARK